jgi:hypothetical protein
VWANSNGAIVVKAAVWILDSVDGFACLAMRVCFCTVGALLVDFRLV